MKLLLDQGLPRSAADLLRAAGVDAMHMLVKSVKPRLTMRLFWKSGEKKNVP